MSIEIWYYFRKQEKFPIKNLSLHLKELEIKVTRRKEIINTRAEVNNIKAKKQ